MVKLDLKNIYYNNGSGNRPIESLSALSPDSYDIHVCLSGKFTFHTSNIPKRELFAKLHDIQKKEGNQQIILKPYQGLPDLFEADARLLEGHF